MKKFDAKSRIQKVRSAIEDISKDGRKRTLFIEMNPRGIAKILGPSQLRQLIEEDCFSEAVRLAHEKGFRIVPLSKENHVDLIIALGLKIVLAPPREKRALKRRLDYLNTNLFEKYWAQTLARHKAKPEDIVLVFPNHVEGILKNSNFSPNAVRWIDKPIPKAKNMVRLLDKPELKKLFEERRSERKARQAEIMRRKELLMPKRRL